ncbi:MAG TPA: hypothetical protein VMW31_03165, partial [Devosiaceae bacterium]|nr:hypothetical protein [Devosiaceae bacterium]
MVSAEQSGAQGSIVADNDQPAPDRPFAYSDETSAPGSRASLGTLFRLCAAFGILTVALVGVFAVYDRARTVEETETRLGMLARQVAGAVAGGDLISAQILLDSTETAIVGAGVTLNLTDTTGRLVASTAQRAQIGAHFDRDAVAPGAVAASAAASGDYGSVTAIMPADRALAGTGWRLFYAIAGALAVLAALGVTLLVMVRRHRRDAADEAVRAADAARADRHKPMHPGKATILNNVGFGLARWDEDGDLVWCNPAYR